MLFYIIFSDKILEEMVVVWLMMDDEMKCISGVGECKLYFYGNYFIDVIIEYVGLVVSWGKFFIY